MTEILTESFCERCGTRYTFESAQPRVRLKGVKVLSRGLKNFVLSDDTSIDEAMAAARSEADREATAHHLDAFHKTFNFCLSCRQYTCPNCWNGPEARCLSCAPIGATLALQDTPAVIGRLAALRDPDLFDEVVPGNGKPDPAHGIRPARLGVPAARETADEAQTGLPGESDMDAEPFAWPHGEGDAEGDVEPFAWPLAGLGAVSAAEPGTDPIAAVDAVDAPRTPPDPARRAAARKAAGQTTGLLKRFSPGQNLDAELDAYERARRDAAATGEQALESITEPGAPTAEADVVDADRPASTFADVVGSEEPDAIEAATPADPPVAEPPAAIEATARLEPEPEAATAPEAATPTETIEVTAPVDDAIVETDAPVEAALVEAPAPSPVVEAPREPEPQPVAATPATDIVEQPTWQVSSPERARKAPRTTPVERVTPVPVQAHPMATDLPASEPQWPAQTQWPGAEPSNGLPFLGRGAAPQGGIEALWAASNQELVAAPPAPGKTNAGIQPCVSCGLSLSANARFCRRCGTIQGR